MNDASLEARLTRAEFDVLAEPVLARIRAPVHRALERVHGGMDAHEIDQVRP